MMGTEDISAQKQADPLEGIAGSAQWWVQLHVVQLRAQENPS